MKSYCVTDVGQKRTTNQDFVYASGGLVGNLPNLFVVADGMGGHRAGDFASKYTVEILEREIKVCEETRPEIILRNAIQIANNKIIEAAADDEHLKGMGTTVVAATIIDHMIYFANVGDSRLYLINQEITQMTKDHSLVEEMVRMGGIRQEDAKHHPDKNIITRAIGAKDRIEIDFYEYRLKKGDTILMCTDGLSNLVDDEEMFHIIKSSRDIVEAGVELIETANNNGGSDNISVVIVEPFAGEVSIC